MDQALNQKIDTFIAANKEQDLGGHCSSGGHRQCGGAAGSQRAHPLALGRKAALEKTLELAEGIGPCDPKL